MRLEQVAALVWQHRAAQGFVLEILVSWVFRR
jgi:hypothetical protein